MKKTILVIEDTEKDFVNLKTWLEQIGYKVLPVKYEKMFKAIDPNSSGDIVDFAIKQLKDNPDTSLILCDIMLGRDERGGNKVVSNIRKNRDTKLRHVSSMIPIIGITRYADLQERLIVEGADFVFSKPKEDQDYFNHEYDSNLVRTTIDAQVIRYEERMNCRYPEELRGGIGEFKKKYAGKTTAFIMTSFADEHIKIAEIIKETLKKFNIVGCMANDGEGGLFNSKLWPNVEVYLNACDFGIGIYADDSILKGDDDNEAIRKSRINPNMSQEVGYMLALQKSVCILKDEGLEKIPTDLAERIYVQYNESNLSEKLSNWIKTHFVV